MLYLAYTKIMPVIFRESLKKLIVKINKEKDELKRNGIMVDGVLYTVKFKGVILLYNNIDICHKTEGNAMEVFQLNKVGH